MAAGCRPVTEIDIHFAAGRGVGCGVAASPVGAAVQRIPPGPAFQPVVASVSGQRIVVIRANQILDSNKGVALGMAAGRRSGA